MHKTTILCQFGLSCHQLTTISPSILNHFWWELYHSLAGVLIPIITNDDDEADLDTKSNHNSVDPNEADDNSSIASLHSTGSQAPVHITNDEPSQLPLEEEEADDMDDTQIPEMETQVPILC